MCTLTIVCLQTTQNSYKGHGIAMYISKLENNTQLNLDPFEVDFGGV